VVEHTDDINLSQHLIVQFKQLPMYDQSVKVGVVLRCSRGFAHHIGS